MPSPEFPNNFLVLLNNYELFFFWFSCFYCPVDDMNYTIAKNQVLVMASNVLKFGLSEKHTKFDKIFLMVLTNQLIYLVNVKTMRKIFSNYVCFSKSPNFKSGKKPSATS